MRRPRGNVIMMALFISIFLFFLSVALVAQNRQDVLLALTVDHRLRAQTAARAGANYALHVMQTEPDWRSGSLAAILKADMESGANWEVEPPQPYVEAAGDPNPFLWQIVSTGRSGFVTATHRVVVEEVGLGGGPADSNLFVFAYDEEGQVAMIDADNSEALRWRILGLAPNPNSWLAARSGPLFTHWADRDQPYLPQLVDAQDLFGTLMLAPVRLEDLVGEEPEKQMTVLLRGVSDSQVVWRWPNPSPQADASQNDEDRIPLASEENNGVVQTSPPSEPGETDWIGPSYSWYVLEGEAIVADARTFHHFARHYFYRGARATLGGADGQQVLSIERPGRLFTGSAPSLLRYDLDARKWSVVVDPMQIPDLREDPEMLESRTPLTDTLALVEGTPHAFDAQDSTRILVGNARGWVAGPSVARRISRGLYDYRGQLRRHVNDGVQEGWARVHLEGVDPWDDLGASQPAVTASIWDPEAQQYDQVAVRPELRVQANMLPNLEATESFEENGTVEGSNCVAVAGDDLFAWVKLHREYLAEPGVPYFPPFTEEILQVRDTQVLALARFDGEQNRWQLLPGGLHEWLTSGPPRLSSNLVQVQAWGTNEQGQPAMLPINLRARNLAVAVYPGQPVAPRSRYVPVVTRR